ncbi:MAG: MotA/TolQ/ExbB proton channel family protein [Kiritimatiellae bacterium]|nr:MotA/TolQ/ExbB proton channel family protein [Kiritimatiellia bacterium]
MVEFFADSLVQGFLISSFMGKLIVVVQIAASLVMLGQVFGKWSKLSRMSSLTRRISRDVMSGQDVLEYYLARHPNHHSPVENIYVGACERLLKLLTPDTRSALAARAGEAVLTRHEVELVRALSEHLLDEEEIKIERGMGVIATIVALAPMLGLLGTVWGVLDAFADIGSAGSANIATMAPAISSALVTTVVGLLVAIPGVMCHARLSASVRDLTADVEGFTDDLTGRIALEFQGK